MAEPRLTLPAEAPLDMPRQSLNAVASKLRRGRGGWLERVQLLIARLVLFTVTAGLTAFGVFEMRAVISGGGAGATLLQWAFLVLFTISFAWVGFSASQCILSFPAAVIGARRRTISAEPCPTAVLVPVYNEEPRRIAAAIEALASGLAQRAPGRFAVFLLSDTNRPDAWIEEESVFFRLHAEAPLACPVYYRRRTSNAERKAGNIADWVTRFGGAYEAMLVLDADSVMGADTVVTLAARMAADPGLGLLQTIPGLVRARTLFARLQQFANRCYGPVFAAGLAAWHGPESNYWGHNAIIRTRAFAEAGKLPVLKGKPPFGGHVMSHDFIEAALLRRAGWRVELAADLEASFEEAPPALSDVIVRDRRWAQGNLQHSRFLFADGLSFVTRLHLFSGIMSYVSALIWMALILCGLALAIQAELTEPDYFAEVSLFPSWPVFDSERAVRLFIIAMVVVLTPKLLGWLAVLLRPRRLLAFGGPIALTLSVITETILSALYAPVMMLSQANILLDILLGRDSGWKPQRRDDGAISLGQALRAHVWHVATGVALAVTTLLLGLGLFFWTLAVTAGLVLSPVLSWVSGMRWAGLALRRVGVLRTPEERRGGDPVVAAMEARLQHWRSEQTADSLAALASDRELLAWHVSQGGVANSDAYDEHVVLAAEKIRRSASPEAAQAWLSPAEKMAALRTPRLLEALADLSDRTWCDPARIHAAG